VCPAGYTTISLPASTLCTERVVSTQNWFGASDLCNTNAGARLCTYQQMRRACASGKVTLVVGSWLADRMGDDAALFVNLADCTNFDGVVNALPGTQPAAYCCLEWMRYDMPRVP
jgi:hypothetical protein